MYAKNSFQRCSIHFEVFSGAGRLQEAMALAARVVLVLCALLGSTAAVLLPPHAHQPREEIVIDGKSKTGQTCRL